MMRRAVSDNIALAVARLRPEVLYEQAEDEVDLARARLHEAALRVARWPADSEARVDVHAHAAAIARLAGLCGMEAVGRVARSLCHLVTRYVERLDWNAEAIAAHLDAMTLLRLDPDTADRNLRRSAAAAGSPAQHNARQCPARY
jgi:hypothetical protein